MEILQFCDRNPGLSRIRRVPALQPAAGERLPPGLESPGSCAKVAMGSQLAQR
jgi:hypothetical protein